ncbi:MAG TPA: HNH endonuclease signature motif containing protein, partial [Micromonosporaceae bacterium]|nr:HNH endonuclease signature motif containing protein [Micromonosporaceae bacterium]
WPVRGGRWPSRPPRPLPFPPPDVRPHVRADPPAPGQPGRDVTDDLGNRPSCDADVRRGVFEPAVAWTPAVDGPHQVVPDWLRRALHVRDAGCRFPGCDMPPEWTDAHLLRSPAGGGRVELGNLVLLCRHHHRFVHEGGWTITRDPGTGILETWRPDGGRYTLFDPPPG